MDKFSFLTDTVVVQPKVKCCVNGVDDFVACITCVTSSGSTSSLSDTTTEEDSTDDVVCNPYITRALNVIQFRIGMRGWHGFEFVSRMFKPVMAHQIFGNEEVIWGYRNLHIRFFTLPNSFQTRIQVTYTKQINNPMRGEVADDVLGKLSEWFPHNVEDEATFRELEAQEDLTVIYGETLFTFTLKADGRTNKIRVNVCDRNNADFMAFHKRFQGLIVFFIDAASIIEFHDNQWNYFYVYLEIQLPDNKTGFIPIGYSTVYIFEWINRARLSQQFILPNFQGKGIGKRLLAGIYKYFLTQDSVEYLTVESPCEAFTVMRDKLDLQLLLPCPEFSKEKVLQGYNPAMEQVMKGIAKTCTTQVKHLYLILCCYYSRLSQASYNKFIICLKKEIRSRYRKKLIRLNNMRNKKPERLAKVRAILQDDFRSNPRIHRDSKNFIKSITPQLKYLKLHAPDVSA